MGIRKRDIHFSGWANARTGLIKAAEQANIVIDITDESSDSDVRAFLINADSVNNPFYYYVCYFKDTQEIYTHGKFYNCAGYDDAAIQNRIDEIESLFSAELNKKVNQDDFNSLVSEVEENEEVAAAALTDLNENKASKNELNESIQNVEDKINLKQDVLNSGVNIKTINSKSIVGSGDLQIGTVVTASIDYETAGVCRFTTIRIDQNIADPSGMITIVADSGGIEYIRSNSHRYLGKNTADGVMTLCQLDDSDSNYYSDGKNADLTGSEGDVFMKLPKFYYYAEEVKTNIWNVTFSDGKLNDDYIEWNDNELIGVYEASVSSSDNKLYSISGVSSSSNKTGGEFSSCAANRGTGYSIIKMKHHNIMAFLFYAYYGSSNCQDVCGSGSSNINSANGLTNSLGMEDTSSYTVNDSSINFWGLENWWGHKEEFIGDASNNEYELTINDVEERTYTLPSNNGYITQLYISKNLDVLPKTLNGSSTTGYCDYYMSSDSSTAVLRSGFLANQENGVAYLNMSVNTDYSYEYAGSRLAFCGETFIYSDSDAFKSLTTI